MREDGAATALNGLTVVITRPAAQAVATVHALRDAGATVLEYPVLDIVPIPVSLPDLPFPPCAVIFVSANAVQYGATFISQFPQLAAASTQLFAIGQATASALRDAGHENVVSPQQNNDSEGLLALPQLQSAAVKRQHVVLMRGNSAGGGRKLIEITLTARGANVHVIECYQRREAKPSNEQRAALQAALQATILPAVMALSVETLENLLASFAGDGASLDRLKSAWLLVPHGRVAMAAQERGFVHVAEVPLSTEAQVVALSKIKLKILALYD